jgi:hypothetical protein
MREPLSVGSIQKIASPPHATMRRSTLVSRSSTEARARVST